MQTVFYAVCVDPFTNQFMTPQGLDNLNPNLLNKRDCWRSKKRALAIVEAWQEEGYDRAELQIVEIHPTSSRKN